MQIIQDPHLPGSTPTYRDANTGRFVSRAAATGAAVEDFLCRAYQAPTSAEIRAHAVSCGLSGAICGVRPRPSRAQIRADRTARLLFG